MSSPIRLLTIIGARPQIIKAAALNRAIKGAYSGRLKEIILHTGQHYDDGMSKVFFDELGLPQPDIQLNVGSASHAVQTAQMLEGIESAITDVKPDAIVIYGDTNSTLAGAIAASKMQVPLAHIEAGLRSFNKTMPEEINRIVADHCSTWMFCPTGTAVRNLEREGFEVRSDKRATIDRPQVILSGDVMYDNSLHFAELAGQRSRILQQLGVKQQQYFLATIHRPVNTDDPDRLSVIIRSLLELQDKHQVDVILPLHPRTEARLGELKELIASSPNFHAIPPAGFLDMIVLEQNARMIFTDSGGVQKEAFFFRRPCVILRAETEWIELVENGSAILADADPERIIKAAEHSMRTQVDGSSAIFGDGHAAERICEELISSFTS